MALARGVNHGWLDPGVFAPVAINGWQALESQIEPDGTVHLICEGTMCSEDVNFYLDRPFYDNDTHGLFAVLFAGIEVGKLLVTSPSPFPNQPPSSHDHVPIIFARLLASAVFATLTIAAAAETTAERDARMAWWREARFGMFIHWGLFSLAAGEWDGKPVPGHGEWIMNKGAIPVSDYARLAPRFNPVKFDAEAWEIRPRRRHEIPRHHRQTPRWLRAFSIRCEHF